MGVCCSGISDPALQSKSLGRLVSPGGVSLFVATTGVACRRPRRSAPNRNWYQVMMQPLVAFNPCQPL